MSFARRPRPQPIIGRRVAGPRARPPRRGHSSPGRLTSRRAELGVWRRRWLARLPVGPILLAAAAALTLVSLRAVPADLALDPASAGPVVVATVELPSGTVVDADDIEVRAYPAVAIPPSSATDTDQVVGRLVTASILEGEPVVGSRLAPDGLLGIAAATPPSWSAFALPVDANVPDAVVGQAVDLYALDPSTGPAASGSAARRVARDARVVAVDDEQVTIAVRAADAPGVAGALIGSTVVTAITGPTTSGDGPSSGS
jgi:Flp pilus assembly protein CpaB